MTIRIPFPNPSRPIVDLTTGLATKEFALWMNSIQRRTGTQTQDFVAEAVSTAGVANATANASAAGLTVPTPGGTVELSPAYPLSYATNGNGTATISVAGHTRTGAAAPIVAGSVGPLDEGFTYYVFYDDPGSAGGAVTFEASTSAASVGSKRLIAAIYVPAVPTTSGVDYPITP